MASVLAKLGAAALQPSKLGSAWRKPLISGRNAARLRKEAIATTGSWPFEAPAKPQAPPKPKKGHRHDREKAERLKNIQDKLANMDGRIAQHRAARRELKGNAIDMLLLTPKLMRQKMKAGN